MYVLTSQRTSSAAEEFAYKLKNLKRATIVGETTGGGAHPTMGQRLDEHFMIGVPFARSINAITKTNWEGTGVEPDVKVPADQALATASWCGTSMALPRQTSRPYGARSHLPARQSAGAAMAHAPSFLRNRSPVAASSMDKTRAAVSTAA